MASGLAPGGPPGICRRAPMRAPRPRSPGACPGHPALCRRSVLSPFRRFVHIPSPRGSRRVVWMSAREGAPTCVACARREVRRARALHAIGRRALRMGGGWMHEASLRAIRSDRPMMTNAPGPKTCSAPSSGRGRAGMVGRGGRGDERGGGRTRMGTGANGDGRTRIDARASAAVRSPALRLRPPPVVRFVNEISVLDKSQKFRHYIPRT